MSARIVATAMGCVTKGEPSALLCPRWALAAKSTHAATSFRALSSKYFVALSSVKVARSGAGYVGSGWAEGENGAEGAPTTAEAPKDGPLGVDDGVKRSAVVVTKQEASTKNPSKAVTSMLTVVRRFLSTTTLSRVLPCEASVPISRNRGRHDWSPSESQDVWTTISARFLGDHVQSLSALGREALRGRGLLACAGSPKEAQRRSRNG